MYSIISLIDASEQMVIAISEIVKQLVLCVEKKKDLNLNK